MMFFNDNLGMGIYCGFLTNKLKKMLPDTWWSLKLSEINRFLLHITAPLFKTSNILQIENLYKQKILQKAYKTYYSSTNEPLSDHPYNKRF